MANKLISGLGVLATGNIEADDILEVQEEDQVITKKATITVVNSLEAAAREAQDDVIEASVGLSAAGAYVQPAGSNYIDASTDVMDALDMLDDQIGASGSAIVVAEILVTNANLSIAGATPYEIVAQPGAGEYIEVLDCSVWLDWTTPVFAWAGGSPKLILEYDTGASHFMEWSNAFITGNADDANKGTWTSNVQMIMAKKIQLSFDTAPLNPTSGGSKVKVWITYIIRNTLAV